MFPRTRLSLALAALYSWSAGAVAQPLPEPELRTARELAPATVPGRAPVTLPGATAGAAPGAGDRAGAAPASGPDRRSPFGTQDADGGVLFLRADRLEGDDTRVTASGRVELRMRRQTVLADWLSYDLQTQEVEGRGNVVLRQGQDWVAGSELRFNRVTETGYFDDTRFRIGDSGARGTASRLTFLGPDRFDVALGTFTTCVAPRPDWFVQAEQMEFDTEKKVGTAHHATLSFFDTRVFYSPWLEFPLSDARKSGFLTPVIGSNGTRGFDAAAPYYLNLAPNYDATLVPRIMTKRGFQLGGQFRYIFDAPTPNQGELNAEVLPNDRQTGESRWLASWRHNQQFAPWLSGYVNYNQVSDDKYFADLAERVTVTSQSTLPQEAGLAGVWGPWSVLARLQRFQTLQDPGAPITPPYNRLPQVLATLAETGWQGLYYSGFAEYVRFQQPGVIDGDRGVLFPQVAWKRGGPAWFFTARGSAHLRQYDLSGSPTPVAGDTSPGYAIPIGSVDAGVVFERDWEAFGQPFVQTLEPRAFYVYIPYRDQSAAPVFDTALDDFNFSQIFTENRYLGNDRIGDANQLTLAVSSRLLDPRTGIERLRLGIGQRFYFADQRVVLPGEVPRQASSSDILAGAEGRITDAWLLSGLLQYNLDNNTIERFDAGVRWNPKPGAVLGGVWRYQRTLTDPVGNVTELKQFDVAGQWPLSPRWTLLGRWNYSFVDSKTLEALAGVEYNADCWALRGVVHRLTTTSEQTTTSFYLQLELAGLARIGNSPLDLLRRSIPGFLRSNDPLRTARDPGFDPYPEF